MRQFLVYNFDGETGLAMAEDELAALDQAVNMYPDDAWVNVTAINPDDEHHCEAP